jgi:hypothetical protein
MNDNVKARMSIYHATPTKIIVFTVCTAFLIGVLKNTILSISDCENAKSAAKKAYDIYDRNSR